MFSHADTNTPTPDRAFPKTRKSATIVRSTDFPTIIATAQYDNAVQDLKRASYALTSSQPQP